MDQGYAKRQRYGGRGGYHQGGGGDERRGGYYGGDNRNFARGGGQQDRRGGRDYAATTSSNRPEQLKVRTNYFRLKNTTFAQLMEFKFLQYRVTMSNAVRRKKLDDKGNPKIPFEYEVQPRKILDLEGPAPIKRRILLSLQKRLAEEGCYVVFDYDAVAYSTSQVFKVTGKDDEVVDDSNSTSSSTAMEQYGPTAGRVETIELHNESSKKTYDFKVRVLSTCDENDTFKNERYGWYIVRLQEVLGTGGNSLKAIENQTEMATMLDIVLKNRLLAGNLKVDGKSLRKFYLPDEMSNTNRELIGHQLVNSFKRCGQRLNPRKIAAPLIGVTESIRVCQEGNMFVTIDSVIDMFDIDHTERNGKRQPIPILDPNEKTIAGVRVRRLDESLLDEEIRHITEALKKITFHMKYEKKVDENALNSFRQKLEEEGKTQEEITEKVYRWRQNKTKMVMVNKRLNNSTKNPVIRSAYDHTFDWERNGERKTVSVPEYYQEQYGIRLKYPKMPIVFIKDGRREGYFPIEFLFQAFGKIRSDDFKQEVLAYNDQKASTDKLQLLQDIINAVNGHCHNESPRYLENLLRQFHLGEIDERPLELEAKVLRQPKIKFYGKTEIKIPSDGSWDLRNIKFANPARLTSFGVLNFGNSNYASVGALVRKMKQHGMIMPNHIGDDELKYVTVDITSSRTADIYEKFEETRNKSQDYFVNKRFTGDLRYGFSTTVANTKNGQLAKALVEPHGEKFAVVLERETCTPTHRVTLSDNTECEARIKIIIDNQSYDLFHCRYSSESKAFETFDTHQNQGHPNSGGWRRRILNDKPRYAYELCLEGMPVVPIENVVEAHPYILCDRAEIECPSIILVRLSTRVSGDVYNFLKFLSNNVFGIQTQVYAEDKYHKGREQYQSNVALKMNTKLFSKINPARAWDVDAPNIDNNWLNEVPTMVVGISLARAGGSDQKTVVTGSVSLTSESGMQMGQTARVQNAVGIVEKKTMKCTIKSLTKQYYLHHNKLPSRILVYRNGTSEGHFNEIVENEVWSINVAFRELNEELNLDRSPPSTTYVVAVSQHNIRIVPAEIKRGNRGKVQNVPSGTCLDHTITNVEDKMGRAIVPNDKGVAIDLKGFDGFDFLLTAQGGLKGTSKPIFYRTIWNQNFLESKLPPGSTQLTKHKLEQITYDMAYSYGTATKAVRMVPVVKYSARLANLLVGSIIYIERTDELQLREYTSNEGSLFGYNKFKDVEDEAVKSELLCAYSPFLNTTAGLRTPFHPHLAA